MSTSLFETLKEIVDKAIIQVGPRGSRYVIEETLFHRAREVLASSMPPSDPDAEALRARAIRCYAGDDVQIERCPWQTTVHGSLHGFGFPTMTCLRPGG